MSKLLISGLAAICLFNIVAYAAPVAAETKTVKHKEEIGMGVGGILGGLIAGPPGVLIGIAGGAWLGDREERADSKIAGLQGDLIKKQTELVVMEKQFNDLQLQFGNELQRVSASRQLSSLEDLSKGVSLSVYFRTGSDEINEDTLPRIGQLAAFLQQYPQIRLLVEAHTDTRGSVALNRELGQKRANSVQSVLVRAGISSNRILTYSYGAARASAPANDPDGTAFDRRVDIVLTLDNQI
jgi:outer membrane protein OmpA-like peptidoglycan-associated protein